MKRKDPKPTRQSGVPFPPGTCVRCYVCDTIIGIFKKIGLVIRPLHRQPDLGFGINNSRKPLGIGVRTQLGVAG